MSENVNKKRSFMGWFKYKWNYDPLFSILIALIIMIILQTFVLGFDYDSFGSWCHAWSTNWMNLLRNDAGVAIIALGMTFVIMTGGIDLSVGASLVGMGVFAVVLIAFGW